MAAPRSPPWAAARRPRQETFGFTSLTAPVQATARCAPPPPPTAPPAPLNAYLKDVYKLYY